LRYGEFLAGLSEYHFGDHLLNRSDYERVQISKVIKCTSRCRAVDGISDGDAQQIIMSSRERRDGRLPLSIVIIVLIMIKLTVLQISTPVKIHPKATEIRGTDINPFSIQQKNLWLVIVMYK
jgi:hypothetical protein